MFMEAEVADSTSTLDIDAPMGEYPVPHAHALARLEEANTLPEQPRVLETLVIEEVSIDGMCGVY